MRSITRDSKNILRKYAHSKCVYTDLAQELMTKETETEEENQQDFEQKKTR